jgi:hypothetical protein
VEKGKNEIARRALRPQTMHFNVDELIDALAPLAKLKDPGFAWDGSKYPKESRGLGIDATQLKEHQSPLSLILSASPSGFPSMGALRKVFEALQDKFNVFDLKACVPCFSVAANAADRWRIMCKDVYLLAKGSRKASAEDLAVLKPLTDMIVFKNEQKDTTEIGVDDVDKMFPDMPSDSERETGSAAPDACDVARKCPLCIALLGLRGKTVETDSSADEGLSIPGAKKGEQRKSTMAAEGRRSRLSQPAGSAEKKRKWSIIPIEKRRTMPIAPPLKIATRSAIFGDPSRHVITLTMKGGRSVISNIGTEADSKRYEPILEKVRGSRRNHDDWRSD